MPLRVPSRTIPLAVLAAALVLLTALHQRLPGSGEPRAPGGQPAIEAVRTAPADPFRYGGRTVADVLSRIEPPPGWTDLGWQARPRPGGAYRVIRRYRAPSGALRAYRFRVGPELDTIQPDNGRARRLMDRGRSHPGGPEEPGG